MASLYRQQEQNSRNGQEVQSTTEKERKTNVLKEINDPHNQPQYYKENKKKQRRVDLS